MMAKITVEHGLNKVKLGFIVASIILVFMVLRANFIISENPDITVNGIPLEMVK
jgi:hypothetical protein